MRPRDVKKLIIVDPSLKDFVGHHFEYDRAICAAATASGVDPVVLGHDQALPEIFSGLPFKPSFSRDIWKPYPGEERRSGASAVRFANRSFLAELTEACKVVGAPAGSVVFGHMITSRQMSAWAQFARSTAARRGWETVLLLRYQSEFYGDDISAKAFRVVERVAKKSPIRIVTDSERLSAQIGRLTTLPVGVVSIPHVPDSCKSVGGGQAASPLRVVSLGNARDEKGVLELIQAVRIIDAAGASDRFHFELQVNDPSPDIADAIRIFASERRQNVTLHREALDSRAYYDLLARADLVALPYWRSIYEARTSGVFLEAIAAGKPVICTEDTWMSDELAKDGAGLLVRSGDAADLVRQLARAEADRSALTASATAAAPKIRRRYDAKRSVDEIFGRRPVDDRDQSSSKLNAAVLYPWGDARRAHAGASLRTNLLAHYLVENGANVRLLQNSADPAESRGNVKFESYSVDERLRGSRIDKVIRWLAANLLGGHADRNLFFRMFLHPLWDRKFRLRLNEIVRWADVVYLEYPFWAFEVARTCARHDKRLVLTAHDVLSDQLPSGILRSATRFLECRTMNAAPTRFAVSEEDKTRFSCLGVEVGVIRHPIDVDAMRARPPVSTRALVLKLIGAPADTQHVFMFVGSAYLPNVEAAKSVRAIAKAFAQRNPGRRACFVVAGGCHERATDDNFVALGRIDDLTLRLLYLEAAAVIIPLRAGTGASLKTIEAFAAAKPVIGTKLAFRGLAARNDSDCLMEETDEALVTAIERLIEDPQLLDRVSQSAGRLGEAVDFRSEFRAYLPEAPYRPGKEEAVVALKLRMQADYLLAISNTAIANDVNGIARACLKEILNNDPENGQAMMLLAKLCEADGDDKAALQLIDRSLTRGAPPIEALRVRAGIRGRAGLAAEIDDACIGQLFMTQTFSRDANASARAQLWQDFRAGERRWIAKLLGPLLQERPDFPDPGYWFLHAHCLMDIGGDDETVIKHFERSAELGFDKFWANFHLSRVLDRSNRADASLAALRRALSAATSEQIEQAARPAMDALWRLFHHARYLEGADLAQNMINGGLNSPQAYFLLGECLKNGGRNNDAAVAAFDKAEALGHQPFWVCLNRGSIYAGRGEVALARSDFLNAYASAHDSVTAAAALDHARADLDQAFREGRHSDVEETCRALLRGWSENAYAHYMLAETLNSSGRDYLGAAEHYALAWRNGHDAYWSLFNRSRALSRAGQADKALEDLLEAIYHCQNYQDQERLTELLQQETYSRFDRGDYEGASEAAAGWCRTQSSSGAAHYMFAECLLILNGDLEMAERHYNLALSCGYNAYWTRFNRAQVYRRKGELDRALCDLLQALHLCEAERREGETVDAACDLAVDLLASEFAFEARPLLAAARSIMDTDRLERLLAHEISTLRVVHRFAAKPGRRS